MLNINKMIVDIISFPWEPLQKALIKSTCFKWDEQFKTFRCIVDPFQRSLFSQQRIEGINKMICKITGLQEDPIWCLATKHEEEITLQSLQDQLDAMQKALSVMEAQCKPTDDLTKIAIEYANRVANNFPEFNSITLRTRLSSAFIDGYTAGRKVNQ